MALEAIEGTSLWRESLAARADDPAAKHRDKLRSALITMRENVLPFVRSIHRDVLGLTVHEESHLDALWLTADTIAGEGYTLTPVEAFVFGASILLHDTGLAIAAYPGGMAELKETTVWRDAAASVVATRSTERGVDLTTEESQQVLFSALRKLHAEQAEKLIGFTFKRPGREEAIPLLQDIGLKDALGAAIGRIAHSHHWRASELSSRLVSLAGGVPGYPSEWTLNEVKIACLLRCADAAHIDSLRAPTMLYTISTVEGASRDHWIFQNKLNTVTRVKDKLVYYAGQPFDVTEASSWWLAYDTMQMVDQELKSSNAILEETGAPEFSAKGVQGIESPRLLAKTVRVEGWTPVNAEVKVSDPVHLAKTLGGRNLYGTGILAPIRELLQNAVDAVRARRVHQHREADWGRVRVTVEQATLGEEETWLHVDDNGIGMSERVITGPLIDFGKSFWSSSLLEEEFPGLRSNRPEVIGKFGIGFFSIFLLGDLVRVISRRFDDADNSARVLSFDELTRRPLLRVAATGELPMDYSTRVSVKLSSSSVRQLAPVPLRRTRFAHTVDFIDRLVNLVAATDVDIELVDRVNGRSHRHRGDWLQSNASDFLTEVCSLTDVTSRASLVGLHEHSVREIQESDGKVVGRAAFLLRQSDQAVCLKAVGGFTLGDWRDERFLIRSGSVSVPRSPLIDIGSLIGVLTGETSDASRSTATSTASAEAIANWAAGQEALIDVGALTSPVLVDICQRLLQLGFESSRMPFGFLGGGFATVQQFREAIAPASSVDIPLSFSDYRYNFEYRDIKSLTTAYYTSRINPAVAVVNQLSSNGEFLTEDERREIADAGRLELSSDQLDGVLSNFAMRYLFDLTSSVWRKSPTGVVERVALAAGNEIAGSLRSWALRLIK